MPIWHSGRLKDAQPGSGGTSPGGAGGQGSTGRPSLQVWFRCSNKYVRVFRDLHGTGYLARCPSCGKSMRFRVGADGSEQRVFELSCER